MVSHYHIQCKSWHRWGVALCLLLWLTTIAIPSGMAYKPIRKDPPWPPVCQMAPDGLACDLLY